MRNGNGFGSVHKIDSSKKRKKPYRVRVTDGWEWDDKKQKMVQKYMVIGYYATRKEGMIALADYNKNPRDVRKDSITFEEVYQIWIDYKKPNKKSLESYTTAYKHSAPLYKMKMADIRTEHLENVMQNISIGVSGQKAVKTLWNQLFDYAIGRDYIEKNYSKHVKTRDKGSNISSRKPFTKEEVQLLWDNVEHNQDVETALILIYTGMRPSEILGIHRDNIHLEERYMIGGIKTEAGRNRTIPISKKILPFIERRVKESEWLVCSPKGQAEKYGRYRDKVWNPMMESLGLNHTPHECRHTGISLMTDAGIDGRLIKMIVGHRTSDITERYSHAYIDSLVSAIDKL